MHYVKTGMYVHPHSTSIERVIVQISDTTSVLRTSDLSCNYRMPSNLQKENAKRHSIDIDKIVKEKAKPHLFTWKFSTVLTKMGLKTIVDVVTHIL